MGVMEMLKNVLQAIREGDWYFEPKEVDSSGFAATTAIPGTKEKLAVLASRISAGLPLWHEDDRSDYDEEECD
jgi:hypothetical protein